MTREPAYMFEQEDPASHDLEYEQPPVVFCEVDYPHHPHLIVRDWMRSISDAPQCEGIEA